MKSKRKFTVVLVAVATGIEDWARDGHIGFEGNPIKLLKLHGSIDWIAAPAPVVLSRVQLIRRRFA